MSFPYRRVLLPAVAALTAFSWSAVAVRAGGLSAVLPFVAPTALLAIGIAWLAFAFAGVRFPQLSALWSSLIGGLTLSPIVALAYGRGRENHVTSLVVLIIALAASAAMGGAFWQIGRRSIAALREWRRDNAIPRPQRASPAWTGDTPQRVSIGSGR